MRYLQALFHKITRIFRGRTSRPEDIPRKLDAEAMEKALKEARFLHSHHAVNVESLKPGEIPGLPRRADK